jgi:hypothetical protein
MFILFIKSDYPTKRLSREGLSREGLSREGLSREGR